MRRTAVLLGLLALLILAACAGAPPATPGPPLPQPATPGAPERPTTTPPGAAPFSGLAARFTDRALEQESSGNLRQALESWKIVAALRPEAADPARRVSEIGARLAAEAGRRYRDGLARLQEGNAGAARRELLLALAADPDHPGALEALKKLGEPEAVQYTVAAGDTFETIARKHYGDAAKAALVALANDLDPVDRPAAGTVLSLPSLTPSAKIPAPKKGPTVVEPAEPPDYGAETEPAAAPERLPAAPPAAAPAEPQKPVDPAEQQLAKAAELLKARRFAEAAEAAEKLSGHPAVGKRARELEAGAWFGLGDAALNEDRFAEAAEAYKKADPALKNVSGALAAVERRKKVKAEENYNEGVRLFINQKLDDAIRSWEQTLALNPEHPKAQKDIEKARAIQQKLKDLH